MKTILLATDGSPSAELATGEAIALAAATGWPLRIVTVWNVPIQTGYGYEPMALPPDLAEVEEDHARELAAAAAARAVAAGLDATFELREGSPAEEICAAAAATRAALIVIGAHGWGAFKRFLFGSVSTHVMHAAPCPVLVVRADENEPADSKRAGAAAVVS
jgi:nucleotide-binding universal stress UspA family protein